MVIGIDGAPFYVYDNLSDGRLFGGKGSPFYALSFEPGDYPSVAIGADGMPVISWYNTDASALSVTHCDNVECSARTWYKTVDDSGDVGAYNSIAIGADGLPIISYHDGGRKDLKVVHCSNRFCMPYVRP